MSFTTVVGIAGVAIPLISSLISSSGSKKAANTESEAGKAAVYEQAREYDLSRAYLAPFRDTGISALYQLRDYLGLGAEGSSPTPEQIMAKDPGYQFRLDQGNKAITNAASARGMNLSGATLKELTQYGQDYASGEFDKIIQRLSGVANMGQASSAMSATLTGQQGQSAANIIQGIGNAQAAGQVGQANAYSSALNNVNNSLTLKSVMNNSQATSSQMGGATDAMPIWSS